MRERAKRPAKKAPAKKAPAKRTKAAPKVKVAKVAEDRLTLEYLPLSVLKRWPRNPKTHADAVLDASFEDHGFTIPLLRDERTGALGAGHGRLDRLEARKARGEPPPKRVLVDGATGEWLAPVIRGVRFKSDADLEDYLIRDNRAVMLGAFDEAALGTIMKSLGEDKFDFARLGYDQAEVDKIVGHKDPPAAFPPVGPDIHVTHTCPKCGYKFS